MGLPVGSQHSAALRRFSQEHDIPAVDMVATEPQPERLMSAEDAARGLGLRLGQTRRRLRADPIAGFSHRVRAGWLRCWGTVAEFAPLGEGASAARVQPQ